MSSSESPTGDSKDEDDTLASATRALTEALGQLTRVVVTEAQQKTGGTLSSALHTTSRELAAAASAIGEKAAKIHQSHSRERNKAERTREDLLRAARRVFAARGYEGASVADIAAEAGYTKGALYANFASKEALFLEMVRGLDREQKDLLARCFENGTVPPLCLEPSGRYTSEELESILIGLEWWTYAVRHEEAHEELGGIWDGILDGVARFVAWQNGRETPLEDDFDTAFGLVAIYTLSNIAAAIVDPGKIHRMGNRMIERLTGRSEGEGQDS